MSDTGNKGFFQSIAGFPPSYWLLNLFQMLEKMAYWIVIIQLPVYIAQKDIPGGLHWGQDVKAWIFLWWALVQNLSPVFAGGFADRFGYKRTLFISFVLGTSGYIMLGLSETIAPFFIGTIILGLGLGIFKPALQGSVAYRLSGRNAALGWGIYFMLLNLAVFIGGPVSKILRDYSWDYVFWGSALIFACNFILLLFFPKIQQNNSRDIKLSELVKKIFSAFFSADIKWFILIMSGFSIIYMQFYETLPNFIFDWVDSTSVVKDLGLPAAMTTKTAMGTMVSYEFLYSINSGLIIIGIALVSWLFARINRLKAIAVGILTASAGLFLCGLTEFGYLTILGIVIYTTGEMITNPRFTEHLGAIAPDGEKGMYLSYLNVSFAIGLGGGSLMGGYIYKYFGEKAGLAKEYLISHFGGGFAGTVPSSAFNIMMQKTGLDGSAATELLWREYSPWLVWIPFLAIGLAAALGMFLYSKKYSR